MAWHRAPAIDTLLKEFNAVFPNRDKSSDGFIGDTAHAGTRSDHNPNSEGAVCAADIDTDLDGTNDSNDPQMDRWVEYLRTHPHPDLAFVIYKGRIFRSYERNGVPAFTWDVYTKDPHISHPHISVGKGPEGDRTPGTYNSTVSWGVAASQGLQTGELTMDAEVAQAFKDVRTDVRAAITNAENATTNGRIAAEKADQLAQRLDKVNQQLAELRQLLAAQAAGVSGPLHLEGTVDLHSA